ncbi:hypothetical protein CBF29_11620 [Vagococcus elongatus]|uniref:MobA-like NTP transferase domain-containing protein n=1 Tax=Vagococcus elongatus TaxID=180344 RepID=A0A430AN70_9ENTE|nr:hypothetical protein CBF29_11620 [Vagococcus elongatus]
MQEISAVIMASGQSSRMGKNKLFLRYQGKTFLERVIELTLRAGFSECILVITPEDAGKCHFSKEVNVVFNHESHLGQSNSVRLGTKKASGSLGFLYLTVDQPLLTVEVLEKIAAHAAGDKIVFPTVDGEPESPVFFGRNFYQELIHVSGKGGGREVRDNHPEAWVPVAVHETCLKDIDSPEDYAKLLKEE